MVDQGVHLKRTCKATMGGVTGFEFIQSSRAHQALGLGTVVSKYAVSLFRDDSCGGMRSIGHFVPHRGVGISWRGVQQQGAPPAQGEVGMNGISLPHTRPLLRGCIKLA